jgi:hypothetical protein
MHWLTIQIGKMNLDKWRKMRGSFQDFIVYASPRPTSIFSLQVSSDGKMLVGFNGDGQGSFFCLFSDCLNHGGEKVTQKAGACQLIFNLFLRIF